MACCSHFWLKLPFEREEEEERKTQIFLKARFKVKTSTFQENE